MIRWECIHEIEFIESYSKAVSCLAICLREFDFFESFNFQEVEDGSEAVRRDEDGAKAQRKLVLSEESNLYIFNLVEALNRICRTELKGSGNGLCLELDNQGGEKVASVVKDLDLYMQLMRILEASTDPRVLEETWALVGFLCSSVSNPSNVRVFVTEKYINLLDLVRACLKQSSEKAEPRVLKNCLLTLSNMIADESMYLGIILEMGIIELLVSLYQDLVMAQQAQPKEEADPRRAKELMEIKEEIVLCIGNGVVAIEDTLLVNGLGMLRQVL